MEKQVVTKLRKQFYAYDCRTRGSVLEAWSHGKMVFDISPELMALFRPSVQPYLISWFKYDPAKEIRKLNCPILIIQGTSDIQISSVDGELLSKANSKSAFLTISGMNHIMKESPENRQLQLESYQDEKLPISELLIEKIAAFIETNKLSQ